MSLGQAVIRIHESHAVLRGRPDGVGREARPQGAHRQRRGPREQQGRHAGDVRTRHGRAFGPRVVRAVGVEVPDRRENAVARVPELEVPSWGPDPHVRPEARVRRGPPVGSHRRHRQYFGVGGRIVGRGRAGVSRGRHDERSRVRGADDRAVQRRIGVRPAQAQVDDLGSGGRLHGAARPVVGRQAGGIQNALGDVVKLSEPAHAQSTDRTDLDVPVHAGHGDVVVAHRADGARDVYPMRSERVAHVARLRRIGEAVRPRDRRVGIVAGAVVGVGDRAAGAQRQRIGIRDEVVPVGRQIPGERRMIEARAVIDQRDQHRRAPGCDGPGAWQVDETVVPRLHGIVQVIRDHSQRRGAGAGGPRPDPRGLVQP